MRRSVGERRWLSTSEYELESLLERDKLTRTIEITTCETVLRELIIFKETCDDSEQTLVSSHYYFCFSHSISLVRLVFVEILHSK